MNSCGRFSAADHLRKVLLFLILAVIATGSLPVARAQQTESRTKEPQAKEPGKDSTAAPAPDTTSSPTSDPLAAEPYIPRDAMSGTLQLAGSTTVQQVAALWADGFSQFHPEVKFTIDCKGSELAIPKLAQGSSWIGLFSRSIEPEELAAWRKEVDGSLQVILIGQDPLAVVVHPDNPIASISWNAESKPMLFAKSVSDPSHPAAGLASTWGQVATRVGNQAGDQANSAQGEPSEWAKRAITFYGLEPNHGSRQFIDRLLSAASGEKPAISVKPNPTALLEAVKADPGGATFVRAARATTPGIKVLPVSRGDGPAINPLDTDATDRDYPLVRPLSLVVAVGNKEKPNLLPIEFVTYALSRLGQIELLKDGFVPLSRQQTNAQLELLGQERAR